MESQSDPWIIGHRPDNSRSITMDGDYIMGEGDFDTLSRHRQFRYKGSCRVNNELLHVFEFFDIL